MDNVNETVACALPARERKRSTSGTVAALVVETRAVPRPSVFAQATNQFEALRRAWDGANEEARDMFFNYLDPLYIPKRFYRPPSGAGKGHSG